jgi:hypothetical protein
MDGLACGFGGGGCMNFPLNWAPMAPGNPLAIFGNPVPGTSGWASPEGSPTSIPIFSALTAIPLPVPKPCGTAMCPATLGIPAVWPISPLKYDYTKWEYGFPNSQAYQDPTGDTVGA